jgi:hypothetical protein
MNRVATALVAALLPLAATAAPPATETTPVQVGPLQIFISCAEPELPNQVAFARLAGLDNAGQAYAARTKAMVQTQHECKRGFSAVQLVQVAPRRPEFVALAVR